MTKKEAKQWIENHNDYDAIDPEELEEAFVAMFQRLPDELDKEHGLWSLLCAHVCYPSELESD